MKLKKSLIALAVAQGIAPHVTSYAANIAVSPTCTIVNAMLSAENNASVGGCAQGVGADIIILPPSSVQNIPVGFDNGGGNRFTGTPFVNSDITIQGNNSTIQRSASASTDFRMFAVINGNLTINDSTIANGRLSSIGQGAGIYVHPSGTLNLENTTISDNYSSVNEAPAIGVGGIFNNGGAVTIANSVISNNGSDVNIFNNGGELSIVNSKIYRYDDGSEAAGMVVYGGTAEIINGGIYGGGLKHAIRTGSTTESTLLIDGITISGSGVTELVFAPSLLQFSGGDSVTLRNSRIENNRVTAGGRLIEVNRIKSFSLQNTIISNNQVHGRQPALELFGISSDTVLTGLTLTENELSSHAIRFSVPSTGSEALTILNSTLSSNSYGHYQGGGTGSFGSLINGLDQDIEAMTISNTTIANNIDLATAVHIGGNQTLKVKKSKILNNRGTFGVGIRSVSGGNVTITDSLISGNSATGSGGGIFVGDYSPRATVIIERSLVENNSANIGGGIHSESANLEILNSTLSGNYASTRGGAIYHEGSGLAMEIVNSTVAQNSAGLEVGGVMSIGNASARFYNSIFSGNTSPGVADVAKLLGPNITSMNNLFGDNSRTSITSFLGVNLNATDITATSNGNSPRSFNSIVGPLADNGGPTKTHSLPAGSPAINSANFNLCKPFRVDQRSFARDKNCDIGAFEFGSLGPLRFNNVGSLMLLLLDD